MLIIDAIILVLSLACTGLMFRIWQWVKGTGRIMLIVAFAYLTVIRLLLVIKDVTGFNLPTAQLSLGFYVMAVIGFWILLREIKRTMRH